MALSETGYCRAITKPAMAASTSTHYVKQIYVKNPLTVNIKPQNIPPSRTVEITHTVNCFLSLYLYLPYSLRMLLHQKFSMIAVELPQLYYYQLDKGAVVQDLLCIEFISNKMVEYGRSGANYNRGEGFNSTILYLKAYLRRCHALFCVPLERVSYTILPCLHGNVKAYMEAKFHYLICNTCPMEVPPLSQQYMLE